MFHDDRVWCVRAAETPEVVALLLTRQTWPAGTAFETGNHFFLNDSLWKTDPPVRGGAASGGSGRPVRAGRLADAGILPLRERTRPDRA